MQSCRECKGSTCLIRSNGKHSILLDSTHDGKEILCKPFLPPFHIIRCDEDVEKIKTKTYGTRISTFLDSLLNPPTEEIHLQASPLNPLEEIEPFVLWTPPQDVSSIPTEMRGLYKGCIIVDPILTKHLRAHQRIGVQFLFNCLMGLTTVPSHLCASLIETPLSGCILADDMGLGKTLQCITILYTLLHQGFDSTPAVRKSLIVTPASLVRNWASELDKWLGDKCKYTVITSSSKDHVVSTYKCFQYDYQSRILITSYESLRLYSEHLHGCHVDMVICDEAHRLKNEKTKIVATIASLKASKKLLLSGTPVQNSLDELFTLSSLCISESIIGNASFFRRKYTIPILSGQQMDATENAKKESQKKFEELSYFTSIYILRRTNNLLQEHLPSKTIYAIFCRMSENQKNLYTQTCNIVRKTTNLSLNEKNWSPRVLAAIQNLMKICNHPALIEKKNESSRISTKNLRRTNNSFDVHKSGKLFFLLNLLINIRCTTWVNSQEGDRVVIISNFTQTLDLIETLLENLQLSFLRLDGTTSIKHRHDSVTKFNQPSNNYFAFLLSSKAGGCGINLIGANRLILFDPDWNPAQDKQALARIWREGQKKQCYVYRLFATGTIEERILERQVTKDNLADVVAISEGESLVTCNNSCTERPDAAQNLFVYDSHTTSIIHAKFCMKETCSTEDSSQQLLNETDLSTWSHHTDGTKIEDAVLKKTLKETVFLENKITVVSFVMSFHIGLH